MKTLWNMFGRVLFVFAWPVLFVYLRVGSRTRIIVEQHNKILVVKSWIGSGKWGLPGGGLHGSETPEEGIIRELSEETGINLKPKALKPLGQGKQTSLGLNFKYHQFYTKLKPGAVNVHVSLETSESAWVDYRSLNENNSEPHVLDTLAVWRKKTGLLQ